MSAENRDANPPLGPEQSAYYRHLVNCSSFAIIGADCQGKITHWNGAAEALFKADSQEMVGRHIDHIIPVHRRKLVRRLIARTLEQQQVNEFEIEQPGPTGPDAALAVVITPVTDEQERVLGLAAWVRDITNRKVLQEQLAESEKLASLGTLAAGVAHHFNNILGGVTTVVDFALQSGDPEALHRALRMTAQSTARMEKITRSLLTFAEKDRRQFELSDLTEVLLTFAHLMEKPLEEKGIALELVLQAVPTFEVAGSRMHQLLGNLVENAESAMPKGGAITLKLEQVGQELVLSFGDTGCGIGADDLHHIFDPFFSTHDVASGGDQHCSGLGLSVVHGIVGELHGRIEVTSHPNHGTTFNIHLPLNPNDPAVSQSA